MTDTPPAAEPCVLADWFEDRGRYPEALAAALRWVLDDPASDDPRLRYAGLCDRIAEAPEPCPVCLTVEASGLSHTDFLSHATGECYKCGAPGGTVGTVRGGEAWRARAEFVRVQCELAKPFVGACRACGRPLGDDRTADGCPCNSPRGVNHGVVPAFVCTCPECDPDQTGSVRARPADVDALRRREGELFKRHADAWFGDPFDTITTLGSTFAAGRDASGVHGFVRRGFVESITLPLAALVGGPCGVCHGNLCRYGPLIHTRDCTCCKDCSGTGRTPGHGPAIFAACPVTAVVLSDREPQDWSREDGGTDWVWTVPTDNQIEIPGDIPRELFQLLKGGIRNQDNWACRYPTRDAALAALSAACVAWGRANAAGMTHEVVCPNCKGERRIVELRPPWNAYRYCPACSGSGRVARPGLPPL